MSRKAHVTRFYRTQFYITPEVRTSKVPPEIERFLQYLGLCPVYPGTSPLNSISYGALLESLPFSIYVRTSADRGFDGMNPWYPGIKRVPLGEPDVKSLRVVHAANDVPEVARHTAFFDSLKKKSLLV